MGFFGKKKEPPAAHLRTFNERQAIVWNAAVAVVAAYGQQIIAFADDTTVGEHFVAEVEDITIDMQCVVERQHCKKIRIDISWRGAALFGSGYLVRAENGGVIHDAQVETFVEGDWIARILALAGDIRRSAEVESDVSRWESEGGRCGNEP